MSIWRKMNTTQNFLCTSLECCVIPVILLSIASVFTIRYNLLLRMFPAVNREGRGSTVGIATGYRMNGLRGRDRHLSAEFSANCCE
jgi:hypothetical protein